MFFLVCSDSHGRYERLIEVARRHPDIGDMIFLGDGLSDLAPLREAFPRLRIRAVRGNCDGFSLLSHATPTEDRFKLFGHSVLLLHGDRFAVKYGTADMEEYAVRNECDLLLYGHTHIPEERYVSGKGLHILNPGSIGRSSDGRIRYGLVDILPEGIVTSLATI